MKELVDLLTSSLGINEGQAQGGAGILLKVAKEKLGGDFSKITDAVGNIDDLIKAAPAEGGASKLMGGLASALGGKAEGLGDLAELASGFKKLDLDAGMISQFASTILSFVQDKGGDSVKALLENVLKGK